MNRAERRTYLAAAARRPAYGRPADFFRQLAAMGVAARVVRLGGHLRLDFRVSNDRVDDLYAVKQAFPLGLDWEAECIATLIVVSGEPVYATPSYQDPLLDLATLLAAPPRDAVARKLLMSGARH